VLQNTIQEPSDKAAARRATVRLWDASVQWRNKDHHRFGIDVINVAGRRIGEIRRPTTTELGVRCQRIFGSPLVPSSVMFRRAIVWDALGGKV
jgi:hypothetical protein